MMKRVLQGLVFVICSWWGQVNAQTDFRFADSTAKWNVLVAQWCINTPCVDFSTRTYTVSKDTVIGGYDYQKIGNSFLRRDSLNKTFGRAYSDTADILLYDFDLGINDSIVIGNALGMSWPQREVMCRLDSTDTVFIERPRKRVYVRIRWLQMNSLWTTDVWIEGIGSLGTHFLSPGLNPQALDGAKEDLLCFFEKDTLLYHNQSLLNLLHDTVSCLVNVYWITTNDLSKGSTQITNPATTTLNLQSTTSFPPQTVFQLFDVSGRMVKEQELRERSERIDVSAVSRGMYLYCVVSDGERLGSGKVVIE